MTKTTTRVLFCAVLTLTLLVLLTPTSSLKQITRPKGSAGNSAVMTPPEAMTSKGRTVGDYGKQPLVFEKNQGQAAAPVKFLSRGSGYNLYLTPAEAVLTLVKGMARARTLKQDHAGHNSAGAIDARPMLEKDATPATIATLRMKLIGGNQQAEVIGAEPQSATVNYFIGSDPMKWQVNVPTFAQTRYQDVYRGVDLVYHGHQRQLEYDFIIKPGADPNQIRLAFDGAQKMQIDESGNLVLTTKGGELRQQRPTVYQEIAGSRTQISGSYVIKPNRDVAFMIGAYDHSQPLVIDPVLSYSTYLGGAGQDYGQGIAVDVAGNAYVTGVTQSVNFPTQGALQGNNAGGNVTPWDVFITKLTPSGGLSYSTYLGGSRDDTGFGIAVDSAGNAYVTGTTASTNFPTLNAFQPNAGGGSGDAFVAKLTPTGGLGYSTYLGGNAQSEDVGYAIAVDAGSNAYVTGYTASTNFPVLNPYQASHANDNGDADAFVVKLTADGALSYSTYLGGNGGDFGQGIAVDLAGNAYLAGWTISTDFPTLNAFQENHAADDGAYDAFVTKLTASGGLSYSTYLGGNGYDQGFGIAVDQAGNAYVVGNTSGSTDFPTINAYQPVSGGSYDVFVAKLSALGVPGYSTYLGGDSIDVGQGIAVDANGNAYITGVTFSSNFPTLDAMQPNSGGNDDAFVTRLTASGALSNSTFFGGAASDQAYGIALDSGGNVYLTGLTASTDFPTLNASQPSYGGGSYDAFVARIDETPVPTPTPTPTPTATPTPSPTPTPTPLLTVTLIATRDSFLREGADDTNEGANERLRVRNEGDNRAVVGFDMTGISTVGLQSATLILNVAENSNNWGANGRFVDAHRLLSDWTEGNGRNDVMAGKLPAFRGTGVGVTWDCGSDTNIANERSNCSHCWNGGFYAATTAPGLLQKSHVTGEVSWDVTADVRAGANFGWIIRKRNEHQNGQVRYYSREGAALVHNGALAPRLVLVYRS